MDNKLKTSKAFSAVGKDESSFNESAYKKKEQVLYKDQPLYIESLISIIFNLNLMFKMHFFSLFNR